MADPDARAIQEGFVDFTAKHLSHGCATSCVTPPTSDQRAMAATLIGYAPDKKAVVNDLEYAMQDPDEDVRSSAMRALERHRGTGDQAAGTSVSISRPPGLSKC